MIPQLYRPTQAEIDAVIARGLAKHAQRPDVLARMQRAAGILADWTIYTHVDPAHHYLEWRVPSTKQPDERHYTISGNPLAHSCTCPDWERGLWQRDGDSVPGDRARFIGSGPGAPRLGDQLWCKHRIAISAYTRILTDHLNRLLHIEALDYCAYEDRLIVIADGLPLCDAARPNASRFAFVRAYDAVSFAAWLAGQPDGWPQPVIADPVSTPWPPVGHVVDEARELLTR